MKTPLQTPARRIRLALALTAAGTAATAAMAWGGTYASGTLGLAHAAPAGQAASPARPGHAATGPTGPGAAGDSPEIPLAEAGRAETGQAASARRNGKDHSAHLKKRGAIDPRQVLPDTKLSPGGCLPQYGAAGQCLPAVPPSLSRHLRDMKDAGLDPPSMPHRWSCGEVREYFATGLPLRHPPPPIPRNSTPTKMASPAVLLTDPCPPVHPRKPDAGTDGVACGPAG